MGTAFPAILFGIAHIFDRSCADSPNVLANPDGFHSMLVAGKCPLTSGIVYIFVFFTTVFVQHGYAGFGFSSVDFLKPGKKPEFATKGASNDARAKPAKEIKWLTWLFIVRLFISGATALPLQSELNAAVK